MRTVLLLAMGIVITANTGCSSHVTDPSAEPPRAPSGLYSITGDGEATLYWNPNPEPDLLEYALYVSDEEFGTYILDGTTESLRYTYDFPNGVTQYLAVSAIDIFGNESDLSYETIWDTPRPEGYNLTVYALFYDSTQTNQDRCAVDFSDYDHGMIQALDNPSNDVYIDNFDGFLFLNAFDTDTDVALYGHTEGLTDIDYVDIQTVEWVEDGYIELIEDHAYIIWTYDNHFAVIRVEEVYTDRVIIDWAYQTDRGNTQLKTAGVKKFRTEEDRRFTLHIPKKK